MRHRRAKANQTHAHLGSHGGGIIPDTINFGIIGTGRISGGHARAAQSLEGTRLAGCADVDPERLAAFCERFECPGCSSYEELLARNDIDAVAITLPTGCTATRPSRL